MVKIFGFYYVNKKRHWVWWRYPDPEIEHVFWRFWREVKEPEFIEDNKERLSALCNRLDKVNKR